MEERQIRTAMVTGSAGAGGSYMLEYIAKHHQTVGIVGIARAGAQGFVNNKNWEDFKKMSVWRGFHFYSCDFSDVAAWKGILLRTLPDVIFHLASDANVRESYDRPSYVYRNNIEFCGSNFFEGIRRAKLQNASFDPIVQHCSTSEVYGQVRPEDVPIKETHPKNVLSPYGISKVAQDSIAESYGKFGLKIIRTRMFTYINPRRSNLFASAFAMQVARIESGLQAVLTHGNLDSVRTIIDVRDAMDSYWIAVQKCRFGEAYNIGGKRTISVGEFLEVLKSKAHCTIATKIDPALLRPSDVTLQIPDTSKFESETGWQPKYSFEESVEHLLDHCRHEVFCEIANAIEEG